MSEKISKRIFIGEIATIIFPSSLILLVSTFLIIQSLAYMSVGEVAAIVPIIIIAWSALVSGIVVSKEFMKHSISGLRQAKSYLWWLCSPGILLPVLGLISGFSTPSPKYSTMATFRLGLEAFIFGIPMIIPLLHLLLERFLRKETNTL